jgi:hypothetical protein
MTAHFDIVLAGFGWSTIREMVQNEVELKENIMKKCFLIMFVISVCITNTFAWQYVQGKVKRVWVNGWSNDITFELQPNSGYTSAPTRYGINSSATDAVKNRNLSVLLSAQNSGQDIFVFFNESNNTGPVMYVGNDSYQTYGVQSISIVSN